MGGTTAHLYVARPPAAARAAYCEVSCGAGCTRRLGEGEWVGRAPGWTEWERGVILTRHYRSGGPGSHPVSVPLAGLPVPRRAYLPASCASQYRFRFPFTAGSALSRHSYRPATTLSTAAAPITMVAPACMCPALAPLRVMYPVRCAFRGPRRAVSSYDLLPAAAAEEMATIGVELRHHFLVRLAEALPLAAPPGITDSWQRLLWSQSDLYSKLVRVPLAVVDEGRGREQLLPESSSARELRSVIAQHCELVAGERVDFWAWPGSFKSMWL